LGDIYWVSQSCFGHNSNTHPMKIKILLIFFCSVNGLMAQENTKYYRAEFTYEVGTIVYSYVGLSELKKHPHIKSKTLSKLVLGDRLVVDSTYRKDWNDTNYIKPEFIKVRNRKMVGYISTENLAFEKIVDRKSKNCFLFRLMENIDTSKSICIKMTNSNGSHIGESRVFLFGDLWSLYMLPNKGLDSLKGIIVIDYAAEACGLENGISYIGWNTNSLYPIAHLHCEYSGGSYYYVENLRFPADSDGVKDEIWYRSELFEMLDEEENKSKTTILESKHKWVNGKIVPALKEEE